MPRASLAVAALLAAASLTTSAQQRDGAAPRGRGESARPTRPPLFFKEVWKQTPEGGEHPVTRDAVATANLELKIYGAAAKDVLMSGSAQDEGNPTHLWTGMCATPCGATLRDSANAVDLSGLARIRWNTKVSGLHQVRPLLKLADGTLIVGDHADGSTADWHVTEFSLSEVRWLRLDADKIVTKGNWLDKPDLTKVEEVGFVDLMPSSGHGPGGWSDIAAIEVFGRPVKR